MKKSALPLTAMLAALTLTIAIPLRTGTADERQEKWAGVDETVVEKFAAEAGRPPRDPYINIGEGDLLLFCFLLAGAVAGFIVGYYFRALFKEGRESGK